MGPPAGWALALSFTGAVSRAADAHVFLREHEDVGHVVVDAVARSWPPPASVVIARPGLVWEVVNGADASRVKGRKVKQSDGLTLDGLVLRFLPQHPETVATICARIEGSGLHIVRSKVEGMLGLAVASERAVVEIGANRAKLYGREPSLAGQAGTVGERVRTYALANLGASHGEIAAALLCTVRTVGRALGAA